jgi:ABC-type phosphate/phosphonate transport system substrate-binding protein
MTTSKRMLFLTAAIVLAAAGLLYRASSSHSARTQANQIVSADTAGTDTATQIASLKSYVGSHMGSSIRFSLAGSYNRAVAAAQAAASAGNNYSQIYADAQKACSSKSDSLVQAHCNQAYLAAHLASAPSVAPVVMPVLASYQYNLVAPLWTPDLAGALLLGALVALILGLVIPRRKRYR